MAEVAFHFNVDNRLAYTCRLLRKAWRSGHRCMVTGGAQDVAALDQALWTFSGDDFVPHAGPGASDSVRRRSPIVLDASPREDVKADVLVNLWPQVPDGIAGFTRVIEIVSTDEDDRRAARSRWRHYAEAGWQMVQHDLRAPGPA